jgi:hypothetical protein
VSSQSLGGAHASAGTVKRTYEVHWKRVHVAAQQEKAKESKIKTTKVGKLSGLLGLPLDIFFEVRETALMILHKLLMLANADRRPPPAHRRAPNVPRL